MSASSLPAVLAWLAGDGKGSRVGGVWPGVPTFVAEPLQAQAGDFVAVAWAGPESDAATAGSVLTNAAAGSAQESYTVTVQLVAWNGNGDVVACIGRACAMYDTLFDALAADPRMGGAVSLARVSSWGLPLDQTGQGALVTLSVAVAVEAFRA